MKSVKIISRRLLLLTSLGIILFIASLFSLLENGLAKDNFHINMDYKNKTSNNILGENIIHVTKYEDTLLDLARENGLGFIDIIAANKGIDPWVPGSGTKVFLPTSHILPAPPREGIVINLGEHRLYIFKNSHASPITFPIGVGREGWVTPLGRTKILSKKSSPFWFPPKSIRDENPDLPSAVAPGPNNPLGSHALYFSFPGYLLHGTNQPWGVGRRVSHGCIRMYPEDIIKVFELVEIDTPVLIINEPIKVGWNNGNLYLEAHPEPEQSDQLEAMGYIVPSKRNLSDTYFRIRSYAGKEEKRLNWSIIRKTLASRTGIPTIITD